MFALKDRDETAALLDAAGFSKIEIEPISPSILLGGGGTLDESRDFLLGTALRRGLLGHLEPDDVPRPSNQSAYHSLSGTSPASGFDSGPGYGSPRPTTSGPVSRERHQPRPPASSDSGRDVRSTDELRRDLPRTGCENGTESRDERKDEEDQGEQDQRTAHDRRDQDTVEFGCRLGVDSTQSEGSPAHQPEQYRNRDADSLARAQ